MSVNDNTVSFETLSLPADSNTIYGGGCLASASGSLDPNQIAGMEAWLSTRSVATANLPYLASVPTIYEIGGTGYDATQGTASQQGTLLTNEAVSGVPTGLRLPGVAGNYISRPDPGVATDDLDEIIELILDNTVSVTIGGQIEATAERQWFVATTSDSKITLATSPDGTSGSQVTSISTLAITTAISARERFFLRITRDGNNGASGNTTEFFTGPSKVGPWAQLGTSVVTAGTTTISNSGGAFEIGSGFLGTSQPMTGKVFYWEHRDTIDGAPIAIFDASQATPYQTTILDSVDGAEWTVEKSAAYTGQDGDGELFVGLPGVDGDEASIPSDAAFSGLTDIDIKAKLKPVDWTSGANADIVSKFTLTTDEEFLLALLGTGAIAMTVSTDGTPTGREAAASTAVNTFATGVIGSIRGTRAGATGDFIFYTSTDWDEDTDTGTWAKLGDTVPGGAGAIHADTNPVVFGQRASGAELFAGDVYAATVSDAIGGAPVLKMKPDALGSTSWVDPVSGQTVTVHQSNYDVARFEEALGNYTHLPGVAGNYVSGPAYIPTSGITISTYHGRPTDYSPAADMSLFGVYETGTADRCWLNQLLTTGILRYVLSTTGASGLGLDSTAALPAYCPHWRYVADWDNDTLDFEYSFDGIQWSRLGDQLATLVGVPYAASVADLNIGSHNAGVAGLGASQAIRATIYQDGVLVRDYNAANGHANSVAVSGGASEGDYTINSTGADPAVIVSAPVIRADGTDDFYDLNAAIIALGQPATIIVSSRAWDANSFLLGHSTGGTFYFTRNGIDAYQLYAGANLTGGTYGDPTQVMALVVDGTGGRVDVDGVTILSGDVGTNWNPTYLFRNTTAYGNIDFLDLAIFSRVLTDAEILSVTKFFAERANAGITI